MTRYLSGLTIVALTIVQYALFGLAFSALWALSFASVGLPSLTPLQAATGWAAMRLLMPRRDVKIGRDALIDGTAYAAFLLTVWAIAVLAGRFV